MTPAISPPEPWVLQFLQGVRPGGRILDLACGSGRHAAVCLAQGYAVTALDREIAAARQRLPPSPALELDQIDLEDGQPWPYPPATFDGVIVVNYLWRPLLAGIVEAVKPDGLLIYQTFRHGNARYGKPSNPQFLLQPGELLAAVRDRLHVIAFEEVRLGPPTRLVQRIAAVGPDHGWVNEPPSRHPLL